jgi:hypothetical protein
MPEGGPAAVRGVGGSGMGRAAEPVGTIKVFADLRERNRRRARLIRNLRRIYGYGHRAAGGLVIELAHPINALAAAIRERRPVIAEFATAGGQS